MHYGLSDLRPSAEIFAAEIIVERIAVLGVGVADTARSRPIFRTPSHRFIGIGPQFAEEKPIPILFSPSFLQVVEVTRTYPFVRRGNRGDALTLLGAGRRKFFLCYSENQDLGKALLLYINKTVHGLARHTGEVRKKRAHGDSDNWPASPGILPFETKYVVAGN
jgi:hypothetical protein